METTDMVLPERMQRSSNMKPTEIVNRFTYHAPVGDQAKEYNTIRGNAKTMAEIVNGLCPDNREKSIAITKIEEAVMWANASIARGEREDEDV